MKIYHTFRRLMQKNSIKLSRYFSMEPKNSLPYENDAIRITLKVIMDENSKMLISPLSGKKFIKNEKLEMYIILSSSTIQIINHKYSYVVYVSDKKYDKLINFFNEEVEKRREIFEKEIMSNIGYSMKNILNSINNEK